jgi:hypothetical protein
LIVEKKPVKRVKAVPKKPVGRPSIATPALKAKILERISAGESLNAILKTKGYPHYCTVLDWVQKDKEFSDKYARAREDQADTLADELMSIVDEQPPTDEHGKSDSAWVAWQRNRIDARKWVASKLKPKKYGERQHIDLKADVTLTDAQVEARLAQLIEKANG